MPLLKKNIIRICHFFKVDLHCNVLTMISIIYLSSIIPIALGFNLSIRVFFLILVIFSLARFHFITVIVVFLYSLICAMYLPVGFTYGRLNNGMLYALSETNTAEVLDNLSNYAFSHYLLSLLIILLSCYYIYSYWKSEKKTRTLKFQCIFLILFSIAFFFTPPGKYIQKNLKRYHSYQVEVTEFRKTFNIKPSWNILSVNKQRKNIVVVIGESVNREYLSLYGYHHQTTPFLNTANGIFIDGYISTAPHTVFSLMRTLAQTDNKKDVNIANNVVTLAKQAGYKTYWISNQGVIGKHDTIVSKIAMFSDNVLFLNQKADKDKYKDDFVLLDELDKILVEDPSPKIVFIHMYGSHVNPCKRLFNYPNTYKLQYGNRFNCYLATLNKLDSFIENINNQLIQSNLDYSLIYFSDHGQKMSFDKNNQVMIQHSGKYKQGYKVPLFVIKSSIKDHIYTKKNLSAFHFLDLFANEIGVKSDQLSTEFKFEAFPLESNIMVKTYDELAYYDELLDDKIIDQ